MACTSHGCLPASHLLSCRSWLGRLAAAPESKGWRTAGWSPTLTSVTAGNAPGKVTGVWLVGGRRLESGWGSGSPHRSRAYEQVCSLASDNTMPTSPTYPPTYPPSFARGEHGRAKDSVRDGEGWGSRDEIESHQRVT